MNEEQKEFLASITGSAVFIAVSVAFGWSLWWVSLIAGGVAYSATKLSIKTNKRKNKNAVDSFEAVAGLRSWGKLLPTPALRASCDGIAHKAGVLLNYFESSKDKKPDGADIVKHFINLAYKAVEHFVSASARTGKISKQAESAISELLDNIDMRFSNLQQNLSDDDEEALASELQAMNNTVKELSALWAETHRRQE